MTTDRQAALWIAIPAVLGMAYGLTGLTGASAPKVRTVGGSTVRVGNGTARAYVTLDRRRPVEIGVALSEGALEGLRFPSAEEARHPEHVGERYVLPLPKVNLSPFRHVELGWNPLGHEPPGVYDIPHFDFHFYTIGPKELEAMVPSDPEFEAKAARYPAPEFMPSRYFAPEPIAVPQMGVHWLDEDTPEINGQPFTATFLYGSYDGKVIFAEPMITKATIESRVDFQAAVPVAERHQVPGHYPTAYRLYWDAAAREHRIALTGLVYRK